MRLRLPTFVWKQKRIGCGGLRENARCAPTHRRERSALIRSDIKQDEAML